MGAEQSIAIEVEMGVESRALPIPGMACVRTQPLDDLVSYDELFDMIVYIFKKHMVESGTFKAMQVVERGENSFHCIVTTDGAKFGLPRDPTSHFIYRVNKERGEIYDEDRDEAMMLRSIGTTRVLKDPLQVEHMRQYIMAQDRRAGEAVHGIATMYLNKVMDREVKCEIAQPSPTAPGKLSVISESLEKDISVEKLWEKMMEFARNQKHNEFLLAPPENIEEIPLEDAQIFTLRCILDSEKLRQKQLPVPPDATETPVRIYVSASNKLHAFTVMPTSEENLLMQLDHFLILPDCRVEAWRFLPTLPIGDERSKESVRFIVSKAIELIKSKKS